ncbi:four helix bundle protein [Nitratireductor basaltis]|uniref:S23 ribosomal protein n=1 Tax=Nitratireductor basaltis TaxID=472175 RepID=A0A084UBR4_9HYPH|nr:four helix bundle protein [Nitratireductor basaltis]KFB10400.1 hypothetical protein EL18_01432 [Nitratireductor basaltis]
MADVIRNYRDLKVWQAAMALAEAVYKASDSFPNSEIYGLTSQMRRASVSIASNIAEGFGRDSNGVFVQFLRVAQGSLKELETQILLACRVGVCPTENETELLRRCEEIGKMLRSLIRAVQAKQSSE